MDPKWGRRKKRRGRVQIEPTSEKPRNKGERPQKQRTGSEEKALILKRGQKEE